MTIEGNIVNIDAVSRGRVEIGEDGLITSVGAETGQADLVLKDELIFPGFVDLHVHAREDTSHKFDYKEDFASAGEAAVNGGVVAFVDMINNPLPIIDDESYLQRKALTQKSAVDILLSAGIRPGSKPLSFPVPYKVFLTHSVGSVFFESFEELEKTLQNYRGQNISFHCEDPEILKQNQGQPTHELRRPEQAETSAVDFALELIKKYGIKGKICHVSTKVALGKIKSAKKRGVNVTCEVTPHHLYFNISAALRINPPLRTDQDRAALIEGLKNGLIDYLATDHAPHSAEDRQKGASGLPHLDTYGPFVTWLMAEHGFTAADVLRVCSFNPGNFFNQFSSLKYGKVEEGYAGSFTIIDTHKPIKISKSMLKTKSGWSPFERVIFPGSVVYTIVTGKAYKV